MDHHAGDGRTCPLGVGHCEQQGARSGEIDGGKGEGLRAAARTVEQLRGFRFAAVIGHGDGVIVGKLLMLSDR